VSGKLIGADVGHPLLGGISDDLDVAFKQL
jgi:hypothetical protein